MTALENTAFTFDPAVKISGAVISLSEEFSHVISSTTSKKDVCRSCPPLLFYMASKSPCDGQALSRVGAETEFGTGCALSKVSIAVPKAEDGTTRPLVDVWGHAPYGETSSEQAEKSADEFC